MSDALANDLEREHDAAHGRDTAQEREETASVMLTSLAAVATAWSAFQAATWSGVQTFDIARSTRMRQQAVEARLEGDQQMHMDADLFVAFASTYGHDDAFGKFLRDRFPPRLKVATDAWLATRPLDNPNAPPHPLVMREYVVLAHGQAAELNRAADDQAAAAGAANRTSDLYVLATVVLSTIILLASLGPRLRAARPRRVMLALGGAALLAVLTWLASRPVEWAGGAM